MNLRSFANQPGRLLVGLCLGLLLCAGCAQSDRSPSQAPPDTARSEWDGGTGKTPTPRTMLGLARILAGQGKWAEAETVLTRTIRLDPKFLPAYVDLADLYMRQRRTGHAITTLTSGLQVAPQDPVLQNNLGMACLAQGRYVQATEAFRVATAAAPEDARYLANLAIALGMQGQYDESLALYRRILTTADAHHNVAVLCQARRDFDRARREFALASGGSQQDGPVVPNAPVTVPTPIWSTN